MNPEEQQRVVDAFKTMMLSSTPGGSEFHRIAGYHGWPSTNPDGSKGFCAHRAENFPGWHRAYLLEIENALGEADKLNGGDGKLGLPYWDWRRAEVNGQVMPASIREHFGKEFKFPENFFNPENGENKLTREAFASLRSDKELRERLLDADVRGMADASLDLTKHADHWQHASTEYRLGTPIESSHNSVHNCVGFPLTSLNYAGFHPIFHLLHCNVDRIYEKYLQLNGPDECLAELIDHQAQMEAEGLTNLVDKPLLPFKKEGNASSDGNPEDYWTLRDMVRIENLNFSYDVLPPKPKENLEEMPTLALFPDVDVVRELMSKDGEMKSFNLHVFISKKGDNSFAFPQSYAGIKANPHFAGTGAAFGGKGPLCKQCAETKPINIRVDVTATMKKLGLNSRHQVDVAVLCEDEYGTLVPLESVSSTFGEQCKIPAPKLVGPYFESTLLGPITSESPESARVQDLQRLLTGMGYYSGAIDGKFGDATKGALEQAQRGAGLKVDGVAGPATLSTLVKALQDFPHAEDKAKFGEMERHVRWYLGPSPGNLAHDDAIAVIASAFQEWAVPTGIVFEQAATAEEGDIKLCWSDLSQTNEFAFDGPGGKLSDAGDSTITFDSSEKWELTAEACEKPHQFNLAAVALHEIGHIIGLTHDDDPMAVMAPYYNKKRVSLRKSDIARATALYTK